MMKPQIVQFGSQPATPAAVVFGSQPASEDTVSTVPGDGAPAHPEPDPAPDPAPEPTPGE